MTRKMLSEMTDRPRLDINAKANEKRGSRAQNLISDFWGRFGLGDKMTGLHVGPMTILTEEFDRWAYSVGLLPSVPPSTADKKSDEWMAHVQRRHQAASDVRKASTHPRVRDEQGMKPFTIAFGSAENAWTDEWGRIQHERVGVVTIREVHQQIAVGGAAEKVESIVKTKRRQLQHLMESADWSVLPEHERAIAEELSSDINMFEDQIHLSTRYIREKFQRLARKISNSVTNKVIVPVNGGIRTLLAPEEDLIDALDAELGNGAEGY